MRRRGRPGLVGTMARTAVIAGTATAVSNNVSQRQAGKQANQADQAQYQADQAAAAQQAQIDAQVQAALAAQAAQQQAVALAAPAPAVDLTAELEKLAALKAKGLIDDGEFSAMKSKLLGL